MSKTPFTLRLEDDILELLAEYAKVRDRSIAYMITEILALHLNDELKQRGSQIWHVTKQGEYNDTES